MVSCLLLSFMEEVRQIASQNVIAEMKAGFDALGSRIDTLQKVIWPLIVLLATTVFGLLYRVIITDRGGLASLRGRHPSSL